MERHFHEQLDQLRQRLIDMAETVESAIDKAVTSLVKRDSILADEVIQSDDAINRMEMEIDEASLTLMALHQPVASDLRFVTAAMKINNLNILIPFHFVRFPVYVNKIAYPG